MTNSNVYLCDKKERNGKYFLILFDNKEIKVIGENLEWCKVEICSQIILWNGDGEAVIEFLPHKSKKTTTGIEMYRALGYNEKVSILNKNDLFDEGFCKKCLKPLGKRNHVLIDMKSKPKNNIVATRGRFVTELFSEKFLHLLSMDERKQFDIKPVLLMGDTSEYYELIPSKSVTHSGHKGATYPTKFHQSWKCSECGREQFTVAIPDLYNYKYIFINPKEVVGLASIFFVSDGVYTFLVVRNDRWAELFKHKKEIKGITTNPVVVLEEKYVEYPELEEPEKFEW